MCFAQSSMSNLSVLLPLQGLIDDAESCRRKMKTATALIDGLSGERERWTEQSKEFEAQVGR